MNHWLTGPSTVERGLLQPIKTIDSGTSKGIGSSEPGNGGGGEMVAANIYFLLSNNNIVTV